MLDVSQSVCLHVCMSASSHISSTTWPNFTKLSLHFTSDDNAIIYYGMNFCFFGRLFVKLFALCYRSVVCPVCLSACNVRALWPNAWTDQDETWHAGTPRPWPQCVRWEPSSPSPKGHSPQFSTHICCGQTAAWIKLSLGMELGLVPGDFV